MLARGMTGVWLCAKGVVQGTQSVCSCVIQATPITLEACLKNACSDQQLAETGQSTAQTNVLANQPFIRCMPDTLQLPVTQLYSRMALSTSMRLTLWVSDA